MVCAWHEGGLGCSGELLCFDRIYIEQGLSQSSAMCILQDSVGYLYSSRPDNPISLSSSRVWSTCEDLAGM
jgi:hypothetical protein